MKIQGSSPTRPAQAGNVGNKRADDGRFRDLMLDNLTESPAATDRGEERQRGGDADETLSRAVRMLDDILANIDNDNPDGRAFDERTLDALRALRSDLARHAPASLKQDADAMLAVESERLKRPW